MKELGIYIHIPFCVRKCAYCDFLSAPACEEEKETYVKMLCREIRERSEGKKDHLVTSVFFGGGTPSVLMVEHTGQILEVIREEFALAEDAEISSKFLYEVEKGRKGLSAESLLKISKTLSCSCDYILTGETFVWDKEEKMSLLLQKLTDREKEYAVRVVALIQEMHES